MSAVWRMELPPSEKMVLLALADAANEDGVTWMAIRSRKAGKLDFIQKTSLSERTIQTAMKSLEEKGLLHREFRDGKGTIYNVMPDPRSSCTPANAAPTPAAAAPKPSNNPSPNGERNKTRARKRCPEDWRPSEADYQVAMDEGLTEGEIIRETAKFRDHTFGQPRSDWSATYRNWIRAAAERKTTPNAQRTSSKSEHLERVARAMAASVGGGAGEHEADSPQSGPEGRSGPRLQIVGGSG